VRLLLLLPTTTYRTHDFLEAARTLGVEIVCASDEPSTFEAHAPDNLLTLDFDDPDAAAARVSLPALGAVEVARQIGTALKKVQLRKDLHTVLSRSVFEARSAVDLVAADGGTVRLTLNGVPLGTAGPKGSVFRARYGPHGKISGA